MSNLINVLFSLFSNNTSNIINSAGLILDIVGVWLVSFEIHKAFNGFKYAGYISYDQKSSETKKYEEWERLYKKKAKYGLVLIITGFALQLISNWI